MQGAQFNLIKEEIDYTNAMKKRKWNNNLSRYIELDNTHESYNIII